MNTRDIIIICITIIVLLSIGMFVMMNGGAQEKSILTMTNSPSLYEGDSLILKLTDENNTAISNQKVEINLTHSSNGVTENFTLKTNSNGECKLEDLIADNFTLSAKYYGNKEYKGATLSGTIYVKKKASASASTNTNTNSNYKTDNKVDDVVNGWDPSEHEVSREDLGDGTVRITYDDGYFRIVDKDGNILTYGY
ncbi:hypothetical protein [Methanobrevibacter sp.]|uniref:hypothetical protein n=1 Tax=Methanobrevibacter sp. TaxID=66852 RepID=UPI00388E9394